jgi:hypothetical protein
MVTQQQKRRMYKLHYKLKKKGNLVTARQRTVTKRARTVTDIEQKYLTELIGFGYCVCDGLFTPSHFVELD